MIALLDEQCSLKRAVDPVAYTNNLYNNNLKARSSHFIGEKAGANTCKFTIKHYAMDVTYRYVHIYICAHVHMCVCAFVCVIII